MLAFLLFLCYLDCYHSLSRDFDIKFYNRTEYCVTKYLLIEETWRTDFCEQKGETEQYYYTTITGDGQLKRSICNTETQCRIQNYSCPEVTAFGKVYETEPTICRVNEVYHYMMEEIYYCYGTSELSSSVCGGNGLCLKKDTCFCNSGYTGDQCETLVCNGVPSTEPDVCSYHGTCESDHTCHCEDDWGGPTCEIPLCSIVSHNDPNEEDCSGHGSCVLDVDENHVCNCSSLWSGDDCGSPRCYGVSSLKTSSVCSGHGTCNTNHTCECNENYGDFDCSIIMCNGTIGEGVCSNRGICTDNNGTGVCLCNSRWAGELCELPVCFGKSEVDMDVCNGHGDCGMDHKCVCDNQYFGDQCENAICYNETLEECSQHGECVSPNKCSCSADYEGDECELTVCYGKSGDEGCSGRGTCDDEHLCVCDDPDEWGGTLCNTPKCFGEVPGPSACNGHGACLENHECHCEDGFDGDECENSLCNGMSGRSGCSGHGDCNDYHECVCDDQWGKFNCSTPYCGEYFSDDPRVCSGGRGTCDPDTHYCQCSLDWDGPYCEYPACAGKSQEHACHGHGECVSPNVCECDDGWGLAADFCFFPMCFGVVSNSSIACSGHGYCLSPNNCSCVEPYFGYDCFTKPGQNDNGELFEWYEILGLVFGGLVCLICFVCGGMFSLGVIVVIFIFMAIVSKYGINKTIGGKSESKKLIVPKDQGDIFQSSGSYESPDESSYKGVSQEDRELERASFL